MGWYAVLVKARCGETPIFLYHRVYKTMHRPKQIAFDKENHQLFHLKAEHPSYNDLAIMWLLTKSKHICDVFPLRVTHKCDKKDRTTVLANVCHGVLYTLVHIAWSDDKRWREHHLLTQLLTIHILSPYCTLQVYVIGLICTWFSLILVDISVSILASVRRQSFMRLKGNAPQSVKLLAMVGR